MKCEEGNCVAKTMIKLSVQVRVPSNTLSKRRIVLCMLAQIVTGVHNVQIQK